MKLESLSIREDWQHPGEYKGELKYKGTFGEIQLHLDAGLSKAILAVVADQLVESSKTLAQNLTAEVITQPRLESKDA